MKYYSALIILALAIAVQVLTSCTAFTYSYSYDMGGYGYEQPTADTSRWWLKPVYIRTDDTTNPDSMEVRHFVWFHDDDEGLTYVKVSDDNSILFNSRSADIGYDAMMELIYIGTLLNDKPFSEMIIYGSTDNTESRDYNMGYNADVIQAIGLGDTDPAADNRTIEGRAKNRYVDVFVTIADN